MRTPAEAKADALSREADELRRVERPTRAQAQQLRKVNEQLVAAWRVVNDMREGKR